MIAIVASTLAALLSLLVVLEYIDQDSLLENAGSLATISRVSNIRSLVEGLPPDVSDELLNRLSDCRSGYLLSDRPYRIESPEAQFAKLSQHLTSQLGIEPEGIQVHKAFLERSDFAFSKCAESDLEQGLEFPLAALVISARISDSDWLIFEVHRYRWRLQPHVLQWTIRAAMAFVVLGAIALIFVRRLVRPIADLAHAARRFGRGLSVGLVEERGPEDLRAAIRSFNVMQESVSREVERRSNTLAAISHDIRTPLTSLRVHAEMVQEDEVRDRLVANVERIEQITRSALDFLRGESLSEAVRRVDLGALVASECTDYAELGNDVSCAIIDPVIYPCRPNALARALRNLIENATKYAGSARVALRRQSSHIALVVEDDGPGIPEAQLEQALTPFSRLSAARESERGGFGLGLAIVQAIVRGHDGELVLEANQPSGLRASMLLPLREL